MNYSVALPRLPELTQRDKIVLVLETEVSHLLEASQFPLLTAGHQRRKWCPLFLVNFCDLETCVPTMLLS